MVWPFGLVPARRRQRARPKKLPSLVISRTSELERAVVAWVFGLTLPSYRRQEEIRLQAPSNRFSTNFRAVAGRTPAGFQPPRTQAVRRSRCRLGSFREEVILAGLAGGK